MENCKEESKKMVPPYLPYKTLLTFLDRLKAGIPARIDRSVVATFSGMVQGQLFTTLRYLQLMNDSGVPDAKLEQLVASEGDERKKILNGIIKTSYPFLFSDGVEIKRTTMQQLQELFDEAGASGGTTRKCIAFFIAAAKDAGLELSSYLGRARATSPRGAGTKGKKGIEGKPNGLASPEGGELKEGSSWQELLLSKFPDFDPTWPDEVKTKWFEGMNKVMEEFKKE